MCTQITLENENVMKKTTTLYMWSPFNIVVVNSLFFYFFYLNLLEWDNLY